MPRRPYEKFERDPGLPLAGEQPTRDSRVPTVEEGGVELEVNWDRASANEEFIFIPGRKPVLRKHRNVFTDMEEAEFEKQSKSLD